jgi:hypothetical protein
MNSDKSVTANFGGPVTRRVKLESSIPVYTNTAGAAYASAGSFDTIKTPAGLLHEGLVFDQDKYSVTLSGGWNSDFSAQGTPAIISLLSVAKGSVIIDNVVVQ